MSQNPGPPYGYAPLQRRGLSPWTVVGVGCGGCGIAIIALVVVAGIFATKLVPKIANEVNAPTTPAPAAYVGFWQGPRNQSLEILQTGRGSYHESSMAGGSSSNTSLTGARITIDEHAHLLSVTFAGFGKTFRLDSPPKEKRGVRQMVLDGMTFTHTGQFVPDKAPGPVSREGDSHLD